MSERDNQKMVMFSTGTTQDWVDKIHGRDAKNGSIEGNVHAMESNESKD